ncbi:hypothetical protein C1I98_31300 [Spongiactinospora gelatinilytica]|uniref:Uncharacterized protein n=1 Tax=Spongiactinospora gelatinilytica TaxID=2666298 RepID=A0A2W2FK30_9ACTN|nr:vanadium-dependent haloperoxidase [Spongiactinospora gelatinilytica]PZG30309.1 hypothetical protein C1I98_31300 [Spongiactinospora gelatinilytica]
MSRIRPLIGLGAAAALLSGALVAPPWSNDLDGTYKPPGQHIDHTIQVLKEAPLAGRTQLQNAKLFALVSLAIGDAAISAWDIEFDTDTDLWRPESAIRLRDVDPETGWKPESRNTQGVSFSPPFPAYISGHATFGGAWAGVMKRHLGTDALAWTGTTDDPFAQGVQRRFTSFSGAANENALGRVWLGVHYRFDGQFGVATGDNIADWVNGNFLGAPSPASPSRPTPSTGRSPTASAPPTPAVPGGSAHRPAATRSTPARPGSPSPSLRRAAASTPTA